MIVFRHCDPRFPFLREDSSQPTGRWNAAGELTHYFCDTPDGAWAEFLRHEEIHDPDDILTIRRALWAVEIGEPPTQEAELSSEVLSGGRESWLACTRFAQKVRKGARGLTAPSAALRPRGARGWRVDAGLQSGSDRDGKVYALFGRQPSLIGWAAAAEGRPSTELLKRTRHF